MSRKDATAGKEADGEEDDYLTMSFEDPSSAPETSLQRRQRLRREAEQRGRVKSKAEVAAEQEAQREQGLAASLFGSGSGSGSNKPASKGLAMMAKMGFRGGALGAAGAAAAAPPTDPDGKDTSHEEQHATTPEPLRISVKEDRGGIGLESEKRRRVREAAEAAEQQAKRARVDEGEYRERVRRERNEARWERQLRAAQAVAERMEEEEEEGVGEVVVDDGEEEGEGKEQQQKRGSADAKPRSISARPLKSINVLWRGVVRAREEAERDRRMRYDLEQSLPRRLPTYDDDDEDEDDKKALGTAREAYVVADDLDEEDAELDDFNGQDVEERLRKVVLYLRERYYYCFWCKTKYPDAAMDGCPGTTEEDHD